MYKNFCKRWWTCWWTDVMCSWDVTEAERLRTDDGCHDGCCVAAGHSPVAISPSVDCMPVSPSPVTLTDSRKNSHTSPVRCCTLTILCLTSITFWNIGPISVQMSDCYMWTLLTSYPFSP